MDKSFLSDAAVIKASRNFVCLRLATYEDAEEAKYLRRVFSGRRSGDLENTVFVMLSPDGNEQLSRAGRSPKFRSPSELAQRMNEIVATDYPDSPQRLWSDLTLPEIKSMDLGLNVAACDGLPLILTVGEDDKQIAALQQQLLSTAWSRELAGQFVFASTKTNADLRAIPELTPSTKQDVANSGVYVIQPGEYGLTGKVLKRISVDDEDATQHKVLQDLVSQYEPPQKNHRLHVRQGVQFGLKWESKVPITDAMSLKATERLWGEQ